MVVVLAITVLYANTFAYTPTTSARACRGQLFFITFTTTKNTTQNTTL